MLTKEQLNEMKNVSPLYYRILVHDGKLVVVTMQDFDEWDYEGRIFLGGQYDTEEEAQMVIDHVSELGRSFFTNDVQCIVLFLNVLKELMK